MPAPGPACCSPSRPLSAAIDGSAAPAGESSAHAGDAVLTKFGEASDRYVDRSFWTTPDVVSFLRPRGDPVPQVDGVRGVEVVGPLLGHDREAAAVEVVADLKSKHSRRKLLQRTRQSLLLKLVITTELGTAILGTVQITT